MISNNTLGFLKDLSQNNNKQWFQDNKSKYLEAKDEFFHFTEILIHEICQFDSSLKGINPKDCIFRIFRDVRFSKDKSPYKTNFGSFMAKGGRKGGYAGYYLHIQPGNHMLAGGIYMPSSPILKIVRQEIYNNIDEFLEIIENKDFKETFGEIWGEKLVNPPKGFNKDFEHIELLKYKHYTIYNDCTEEELRKTNFLHKAVDTFKLMYPFNRFINYAIDSEMN